MACLTFLDRLSALGDYVLEYHPSIDDLHQYVFEEFDRFAYVDNGVPLGETLDDCITWMENRNEELEEGEHTENYCRFGWILVDGDGVAVWYETSNRVLFTAEYDSSGQFICGFVNIPFYLMSRRYEEFTPLQFVGEALLWGVSLEHLEKWLTPNTTVLDKEAYMSRYAFNQEVEVGQYGIEPLPTYKDALNAHKLGTFLSRMPTKDIILNKYVLTGGKRECLAYYIDALRDAADALEALASQ